MPFFTRVYKKFGYAFLGLWIAFTTDNSFKTHIFFSVVVLSLAAFLHLSLIEWAIVLFAIGLVFISELFNTAIEYLVRMFTREYHELAKKLLDISAGAVLFAAITSVVIAALILLPKLWNWTLGR